MRILVTGGTGMVGSSFNNIDTEHEVILYGSDAYDLRREQDVCDMIYRAHPDAIIHLAAKVGGVKGNTDFVADFFYENMIMNLNVLETARQYRVPKVVSLLSTCVYPDKVSYPLTEDQLHNGRPHQSNFGYAYAKRMLDVHSRAIRQQFGLNYITAIPNNLFGINDNFDLENGHVIPAMIMKFHENKRPTLWGSGRALREFTFADDIARALLLLVENYDGEESINIGNPEEISIRDLAQKISSYFDHNEGIDWDTSKPEGQYRKPSSNKAFLSMFPDFKYTTLEKGLDSTIKWFKEVYPNVRGK